MVFQGAIVRRRGNKLWAGKTYSCPLLFAYSHFLTLPYNLESPGSSKGRSNVKDRTPRVQI